MFDRLVKTIALGLIDGATRLPMYRQAEFMVNIKIIYIVKGYFAWLVGIVNNHRSVIILGCKK